MLQILVFILSIQFTVSEIHRDYTSNTCRPTATYQTDQPSATWYYLKGLCANETDEFQEAKLSFNLADSLGLTFSQARFLVERARAEAQTGNLTQAMAYIEQAVALGFVQTDLLHHGDFDGLKDSERLQSLIRTIEPSFDTWTTLFLFVAMQALFVAVVLLMLKQGNRKANRWLSSLLFLFSVVLVSYVLYWTRYQTVFPYLNTWYFPLLYATGPIFYLYLRTLISNQPFRRNDVLHFVPPILNGVLLLPLILMNFNSSGQAQVFPGYELIILLGTNAVIKVVYLGIYTFLSIRLVTKYYDELHQLKEWYKYLLIGFSGYYATIVAYYVLVNFPFFNPTWDYMISFAMSFFIFQVSLLGYVYPQVHAGKPVGNILLPIKYQKSNLTPQAALHIRDKIITLLNDDKVFMQPLSLDQLSEMVEVNKHEVSMVINKHLGMSFYELLNKYRIQYVQQALLDPGQRDRSIIDIAYEAGFNNKVSFNNAFRKRVGCTPLAYRATSGEAAVAP